MTKKAKVNRIAAAVGLPKSTVAKVVELWMDELAQELVSDGRVELRGFGVFSLRDHKGYETTNPLTGEALVVARHRQVHFKAGKALKERVSGRKEE